MARVMMAWVRPQRRLRRGERVRIVSPTVGSAFGVVERGRGFGHQATVRLDDGRRWPVRHLGEVRVLVNAELRHL